MWNVSLGELVSDSGVLHLLDNTSDHLPIYCNITVEDVVENLPSSQVKSAPKPSWKLASSTEKESFKSILCDKLNDVRRLENICDDVLCDNKSQIDQIDGYLEDLVHCLENACEAALPTANNGTESKNKHVRKVAGWNDEVKELQKDAQFWFSIWCSAGKPLNTELHQYMKRTRNIFHYAVRKCRKSEEKIKSNKLLEACLNNDQNIFEEIKKLRKCKNSTANSIDGKTNNVEEHFANVYEDLYTSVDDKHELDLIGLELENRISSFSLNYYNFISHTNRI